jgi:hypothetical protein
LGEVGAQRLSSPPDSIYFVTLLSLLIVVPVALLNLKHPQITLITQIWTRVVALRVLVLDYTYCCVQTALNLRNRRIHFGLALTHIPIRITIRPHSNSA